MINFRIVLVSASMAIAALGISAAKAAVIDSYTPVLTGGTLIDFEGYAKGTIINNQYPGVTFSQTPSGSPQIDTYPFLFGYGSSSGNNVLTGSTQGGNAFPTIAGIIASFASPEKAVQIFLSDTSPLGDYPVTIFGPGNSVLASFNVLQCCTLPPGYTGGLFPPPGTTPLPGIFVGYESDSLNITGIEVGPSTGSSDAFAVDDLRFSAGAVPEPATWIMMIFGFAGVALVTSRRKSKPALIAA